MDENEIEEKKPEPHKSSAEILSELFSSFNAEPPTLEKKSKKRKKSKKKHKHKDKKHKKKSKHKNSSNSSDDGSSTQSHKRKSKRRIKVEDEDSGSSDSFDMSLVKKDYGKNVKQEDGASIILPVFELLQKKLELIKSEHGKEETKSDKIEEVREETDKGLVHEEAETSKGIEKLKTDKIVIHNLKNSLVFTAKHNEEGEKNRRVEDGEVTESESDDEYIEENTVHTITLTKFEEKKSSRYDRKRRHSHSDKEPRKCRHKDKEKTDSKKLHKHRSRSKSRDRDREYSSNRRDKDSSYSYRSAHSSYRDKRYKPRNDDRTRSRPSRDRDWSSYRQRRSKSPSSSIDKKKLLEIARKNAINMLRSGTLPEALTLGPQAQEKVIAAIKAGGKTIDELTDFCKNLSKKEELGELSSVSSNEEDVESENENNEKIFHHPFQIKDKPTSIVMNIKNATPLPIKTSKEKSTELRMQFPVSSGTLHRKTENEWVPVSPKAIESPPTPSPQPVPAPTKLLALTAPPVFVKPAPVSSAQSLAEVDISTIVSQRLNAMRKLQENPNDSEALVQLYKVQKEMQTWAQSKQQPGQFTGSTGAQILSVSELSSGYQAWARKDQLQNAAPVTGGMGMHLLQKMGWKPGEGLGKEKTGSLEPLLLEVKLDKKGLVANDEGKHKKFSKVPKTNTTTVKTLAGKHPVSLLGEFATKRKLGVPNYECCFECGPDHKKNFLFKVILNGVEYKPNVACSTKKQAKADAATVCLQSFGLLLS